MVAIWTSDIARPRSTPYALRIGRGELDLSSYIMQNITCSSFARSALFIGSAAIMQCCEWRLPPVQCRRESGDAQNVLSWLRQGVHNQRASCIEAHIAPGLHSPVRSLRRGFSKRCKRTNSVLSKGNSCLTMLLLCYWRVLVPSIPTEKLLTLRSGTYLRHSLAGLMSELTLEGCSDIKSCLLIYTTSTRHQ